MKDSTASPETLVKGEPMWRWFACPGLFVPNHSQYFKAISGIDVALWDLLGHLLDAPVCKLLGGSFRFTLDFIWQQN